MQAQLQTRTQTPRAGRPGQAVAWFLATVVMLSVSHGQEAKMEAATGKYNQATKALAAGRTEEAMQMLQEALRISPDLPQAHNTLGTIHLQAGRLDEAEAAFRAAIRQSDDFALAYNNLGAVLMKKGFAKESIGAFERAARLDPQEDSAYYNIGLILMGQGKTQLATRYFLHALKMNPSNTDALWHAGNIYRRASLKKEAEAVYNQLVKVTNYDPKAVANLAQLYASQDMLVAAGKVIDDAKRAGVRSQEIDLERARLLLRAGHHAGARHEFAAIVEQRPEFAHGYAGLAATLLATKDGDRAESLRLAEKAVDLSGKTDARCLYTLGLARNANDDSAGAQMAYLLASKCDPSHVETQINLGVIAANAGQFKQAAGYFGRATELAPDSLDAKYNLARSLVQGNVDYERGIRLLGDLALQAPSGNKAAVAAANLLKKIADHAKSGLK